jgi:P27 family predicted phage terminase small subunit
MNLGRPPKPQEQKRLEGTLRKDRENLKAPVAAVLEALPMPEGLTEREQAGWAELATVVAPMRVVTPSDLPAFRQLVTTWAQAEWARETVNVEGQTYSVDTQSGTVIRKHPAVEILLSAKKQLSSDLAQFGLTPAARQRVSVLAEEKEKDGLDEFTVGNA